MPLKPLFFSCRLEPCERNAAAFGTWRNETMVTCQQRYISWYVRRQLTCGPPGVSWWKGQGRCLKEGPRLHPWNSKANSLEKIRDKKIEFGKTVQILHDKVLTRFIKNDNVGTMQWWQGSPLKGSESQSALVAHVNKSAPQEASKDEDSLQLHPKSQGIQKGGKQSWSDFYWLWSSKTTFFWVLADVV